jgi:Tfp pilus assembly protein PilO|tara:strand:+ start:273 stop:464 length:192 start_codon:yes stop_codon:yes gene_type:complete
MMIYIAILFILMMVLICILGYEIYLLRKEIDELKESNLEFQQEERTKREIGWDSIWKIVNKYE